MQIFKLLDSHNNQNPFTDHKEIIKKRYRIIERPDGIYLLDSKG